MRSRLVVLVAVIAAWCGLGLSPVPSVADTPAGQLVSEVAAPGTPHVLDGRVYSVSQVGNTMFLGGTFTQARNDSGDTSTLVRNGLLAFDATTGKISTTFVPNPTGSVRTVLPSGDGTSVYVGGSFTTIGGVAKQRLARVRISDGAVLTTFNAGAINGEVRDLALSNGRLWIGGAFTHVGGRAQAALTTVNPTTGAASTYMALPIAGIHNGGVTQVMQMDISPDGSRLAAIGNFDTLAGVSYHQFLTLDLTGATSASPGPWRTSFYTTPCASVFDSYMRDVDYSPDGSYLVIGTTGAYGGPTVACDTVARFETASSGTDVAPSWVAYTGGDTTYSVEATASAVYVGGHQRWWNNPFAGDQAGPGAVSREGIAALDPINGLPFSWNPGRAKGVGVFDFLLTGQGLWVASDTDRINNQYKGRIARLPRNGLSYPAVRTPALPNDVYIGGAIGNGADPRVLYRVNAGGPTLPAATGPDWQADTDAEPSSFHGAGSNRAGWSPVPLVDGTVAAGTPRAVFDTELWDPAGGDEQRWDFPVPSGTPLEVRLYFADRCSCTSNVNERIFDVDLDGVRVLNDLDLNASAGHDTATMRSFAVVSDGNVNIDLGHVVENPLISGIEIVRSDLPQAPPGSLTHRSYSGVAGAAPGASVGTPAGGLDWNSVRGAFMVNGALYLAHDDGTFDRRTFDGTVFGAPVAVAVADQITPLAEWHADVASATGMFFDEGRLYYTLGGSSQLFYRYFTPQSGIVGAQRHVASGSLAGAGGIDFSSVRGMFATASSLYWATSDGNLHRIGWSRQAVSGVPVDGSGAVVSGPALDGAAWGAHALFLFQDSSGNGAGNNPGTGPGTIQFVGATGVTSNSATHRVVVPAAVQPGDTLVSYLTINTTDVSPSAPAGWTPLDVVTGNQVQGRSWTRTATVSDAGSALVVTTSGVAKSDLTVEAYRSPVSATTVTAHAASVDQSAGTSHTAAPVTLAAPGWISTHWIAKTSADLTWTTPAGLTARSGAAGTGSGRLVSLGADTAADRPAGLAPGATAISSSAPGRTVMFTTVIGLG